MREGIVFSGLRAVRCSEPAPVSLGMLSLSLRAKAAWWPCKLGDVTTPGALSCWSVWW